MCDIEKSLLSLAALLEDVDLTLRDRIVFCFVPMNSKEARSRDLLKQYAISHSKGEIVEIGIETPDLESPSPEKMADLETDSRMLEIYSWLALRFTNTFKHYDEARLLKDKIGESIQACLKHIRKGVSPVQKKNQSRLPKTDGNA
jgi:ATP-dependent RNA helicase SUPV3L1/SUV3